MHCPGVSLSPLPVGLLVCVQGSESGSPQDLCILQPNVLTTCFASGRVEHSPLPQAFMAMHALQQGLLLIGPAHSSVHVLMHPLQEPRPVVADESPSASGPPAYTGWSGEVVVWSCDELPFVATYQEVGRQHVFVGVLCWRIVSVAIAGVRFVDRSRELRGSWFIARSVCQEHHMTVVS